MGGMGSGGGGGVGVGGGNFGYTIVYMSKGIIAQATEAEQDPVHFRIQLRERRNWHRCNSTLDF